MMARTLAPYPSRFRELPTAAVSGVDRIIDRYSTHVVLDSIVWSTIHSVNDTITRVTHFPLEIVKPALYVYG